MTVDHPTAPPVPARPASGRRRPQPWRGAVAFGGIALVLALVVASCDLLGGLEPLGDGHDRAVRPVAARRPGRPLPLRWGVGRLADPTAMLVDGADAFVVEPYAVSAVAVADGATRWRVDVKDAEPWIAADADTVLVAAVDGFEALRRDSGASRWRVTVEDPYDRGRTVGLVATPIGPVAVLTSQRGGVVGVDAATGATRWSARVDGTPHGFVVTDDRTGSVALEMDHDRRVELHVLDGATGAERWSTALGAMTGLPLVDGPRLVLDTGEIDTAGTVVAFDLATGARRWTAPVADSSEPDQGGIVDGDRVVLVDGLGTVTALDRTTGRRRWARELPAPVFHGRPVALGDALVLRDITGVVQVLDRATGRHRGSFRVAGVGVGLGAGPGGLVVARQQVDGHEVVGLPQAMLSMRTSSEPPPVLVPATRPGPTRRGRPGAGGR